MVYVTFKGEPEEEMGISIDGVEMGPVEGMPADGIIGFRWDQNLSSPALMHIDRYGNEVLGLTTADFDAHPVWGGMRRCTMAPDGGLNHYGSNPRGDGLDLTGADGRVMVENPKFYVKTASPRANVYDFWVSPEPTPGFELWYAFLQGGGIERDYNYGGAFEGTPILKYRDHTINELQLDSKCALDAGSTPCSQPFTGGTNAIPCIAHVGFTSGSRVFVVGETLTCNGLDAKVIDWYESNTDWAGGNAAGTVYIQIYNDPWAGGHWAAGAITDSGAADIATAAGAETNLLLTIANARGYANRIGPRWGIMDPWMLAGIQLLFYIEYATLNSQTAVGRGVVDKPGGEGFNGEMCGADSANTNIGINGTGTGTGTDGLTPTVYRGYENILGGNVWEFIDGWNAIGDAATGKYHIIRRDGLGNINDIDGNGMLNAGNYEASLVVPTQQDGYIVNIEYEDLLKFLFISDGTTAGGGDSTYLCDYWYAHDNNENNILRAFGYWYSAGYAGVGVRNAHGVLTNSAHGISARLEFV
ncbi:unnamed protein product [marine sediment metagenome]|uniref:Uncharacterized protein n=1 Tax=marine sediment metagenome TaxID=412755 RepID=X1DV00_9ZZZZ